MKLKYIIIGGVLLALSALYVVCDRAKLDHDIDYWRGRYEAEKKLALATAEIHLKAIADQQKKIDELSGAIDSAYTVIANLEEHKAQAETALADAREGWSSLSAEAQAKLIALDQAWQGKFDLLQAQDKEKDKIIFSLTQKYQAQLDISNRYSALWEQEKALNTTLEIRLNLADKKVPRLYRQVKLNRVLEATLVATAVILALK
jgi:cell fate (sporulation/competence/biofilm development) regulator YlbF (YheA/YmcA/DUF963 family)